MKNQIEAILNNRLALLKRIEKVSIEQLNTIPDGFNNNIIWQLGHLLTTGNDMLYQNTPAMLPVYLFDRSKYGRGSKPGEPVKDPEIQSIRKDLVKHIEDYLTLIDTYNSNLNPGKIAPGKFQPISEEWLEFLRFHEALHTRRIHSLLTKAVRMQATEK